MKITQSEYHLLYNIYKGILNPVNKLINKEELREILDNFEYHGNTYALPYLFFVNESYNSDTIECEYNDEIVALIGVESYYAFDSSEYCQKTFKTTSLEHPGVKDFIESSKGKKIVSGSIRYFNDKFIGGLMEPKDFNKNYIFQSHNPPHVIHEDIVSRFAPDVLYSTPFETTNSSDYPFDLKLKTYLKIKEKYKCELFISTLLRVFAGPREALQNLLIFKNLGISNFIMGRGKNTIGNFYTDTESYEFCKQYESKIGVNIIYQDDIKVNGKKIKGTIIREEYIQKGILPPEDYMSREIAEILINKV